MSYFPRDIAVDATPWKLLPHPCKNVDHEGPQYPNLCFLKRKDRPGSLGGIQTHYLTTVVINNQIIKYTDPKGIEWSVYEFCENDYCPKCLDLFNSTVYYPLAITPDPQYLHKTIENDTLNTLWSKG